jgi:hypothetical protein
MQQYANTLRKFVELAGIKDTESFINSVVQNPPPAPSKPSAEEQLAMAEMEKARASAQKALLDAETDRMKIIMDDDRQRDIEEANLRLKAKEMEAKYNTQVNMAEINALMERDRETIRSIAKIQAQGLTKTNQQQ